MPDVVDRPEFRDRSDVKWFIGDRAPIFEIRDTPAGVSAGAHRPAGEDSYYWKTMHWFFPFYTMGPVVKLGSAAQFSATVPIDGHHCMSWGMTTVVGKMDGQVQGQNLQRNPLPNTSEWLGRFRNPASAHVATDFQIDRETQSAKRVSLQGWTGLIDVNTQDEAMRWSQGRANNNGIVDRTLEHLVQTDSQIIRVRRRLLEAAKALQDHGTVPPGVETPHAYRYRSGWTVLPKNVTFWEGARELREAFMKELPVELAIETSALSR